MGRGVDILAVQRAAGNHAVSGLLSGSPSEVGEIPEIVGNVMRSQGEPLDAVTRSSMESRFGKDFSHVRVHRDQAARRSADVMEARAYTVGNHVVFGPEQYQPGTLGGQRLIAHELAHVVQQQRGVEASAPHLPSRTLEQAADGTAASIMDGSLGRAAPLASAPALAPGLA